MRSRQPYAVRESIALRKQVERYHDELAIRAGGGLHGWFFDIFGPHRVTVSTEQLAAAAATPYLDLHVRTADPGPRRYLSLLERAVAAVDVPVIASLSGITPGGWTDYATALEHAGAAAIELNICHPLGNRRCRDVT